MARRLIVAMLMVVLVAPAVAVCAGAMQPVAASANHDCCPKHEMTTSATPVSSASMAEACCRLADEAGQRVPLAARVVAPPVSASEIPSWSEAVAADVLHPSPAIVAPSSDHVPRHLLLSVLLV